MLRLPKWIQRLSIFVVIFTIISYAIFQLASRMPAPYIPAFFGYVPANLDDSIQELDKVLPYSKRQEMLLSSWERVNELSINDLDLQIWIAESWGLCKDSRLKTYFNELKVFSNYQMTRLILSAYLSKLHNKPFSLKEQLDLSVKNIKYFKEPSVKNPNDGTRIIWILRQVNNSFYFDENDRSPSSYFIGFSLSDNKYWRYEYGGDNNGIHPATNDDIEILSNEGMTIDKLVFSS